MNISIARMPAGRVVFELFKKEAPLAAENFRALCTGEKGVGTQGKHLHFKGSVFHRVIPNFMVQGGDFILRNGKGGESIYGKPFKCENLSQPFSGPGDLAMANAGPNTNTSQFFVTTIKASWLNGHHTIFGRVVEGMDVIHQIERLPTNLKTDAPEHPVVVEECGELQSELNTETSEEAGSH